MTPASKLSAVANSALPVSFKSRVLNVLREVRRSYERHAELQVMLASGFGQQLGNKHAAEKRAK